MASEKYNYNINDPYNQQRQQIPQNPDFRVYQAPPQDPAYLQSLQRQMDAITSNILCEGRLVQIAIIHKGLDEIRAALAAVTLAEGDRGNTDRPPLIPAFDEINRGKLQEAYLGMMTRYVKFIDHVFEQDHEMTPPIVWSEKKEDS